MKGRSQLRWSSFLRPRTALLIPLILFLSLSGSLPTLQLVHASLSWSSPILIDSHPGISQLSSTLQASNGTLWVAFQSNRNNQSSNRYDVIYKTYTNGAWSTDHNLTMTGQNSGPSLVQLTNGTIGVFWSYKVGPSFEVYYAQYQSTGWTTPSQITSTTLNDTQPSAAVSQSGTVWLVWTRVNSTNPSIPAGKQVFYKTWTNGIWSPQTQLTTDTNQNYGASVMIAKDGIVRVTYSKGAAGSAYQLYEKTFNGVSWTADTQIVSSSSTDEHPSMMQDRNGTLWLFWGRLIVVSTLVQYYEVWTQHSYNLGTTWSSQVQLTPTPATGGPYFDSFQPAGVQSTSGVKPIWIFYTSNYNQPNYDIYALQSSGVNPVHDVKVTGLVGLSSLNTPWEYPGGFKSVGQTAIVTIKVNITNIGDYLETVFAQVSLTNTSTINLNTIHQLVGPGNTNIFYFYWNTTGVAPARYGVTVNMNSLPGETQGNMGDDYYARTNILHILPFGDVDQDGSVTITDMTIFGFDFNYGESCQCSHYNPYANIDNGQYIDIVDVTIASANFNTYA